MAAWTENLIEIAGTKVHLTRGGKGPPVLVLHRDIGAPEASSFHDELAKSADVIVPHHTGWGRSSRAEWVRSVRDVAVMHRGLAQTFREGLPPVAMLYFHPWEFDPEQERLALPRIRYFRTYVGLKRSRDRLVKLLNQFHFERAIAVAESLTADFRLPSFSLPV